MSIFIIRYSHEEWKGLPWRIQKDLDGFQYNHPGDAEKKLEVVKLSMKQLRICTS